MTDAKGFDIQSFQRPLVEHTPCQTTQTTTFLKKSTNKCTNNPRANLFDHLHRNLLLNRYEFNNHFGHEMRSSKHGLWAPNPFYLDVSAKRLSNGPHGRSCMRVVTNARLNTHTHTYNTMQQKHNRPQTPNSHVTHTHQAPTHHTDTPAAALVQGQPRAPTQEPSGSEGAGAEPGPSTWRNTFIKCFDTASDGPDTLTQWCQIWVVGLSSTAPQPQSGHKRPSPRSSRARPLRKSFHPSSDPARTRIRQRNSSEPPRRHPYDQRRRCQRLGVHPAPSHQQEPSGESSASPPVHLVRFCRPKPPMCWVEGDQVWESRFASRGIHRSFFFATWLFAVTLHTALSTGTARRRRRDSPPPPSPS